MNVSEFRQVELCLCINRDGALFVWPIPQPSESGKASDWHVTAREGAHKALAKWVRLKPDIANGQYIVIVLGGVHPGAGVVAAAHDAERHAHSRVRRTTSASTTKTIPR